MRTMIVAAALCAASTAASALPVALNYSGTVDSGTTLPGVSINDALAFELVVDNGGTSLENQVWDSGDFVSMSVTAGPNYSFFSDTLNTSIVSNGSISTDGAGMLSSLFVSPFRMSGPDSQGNDFFEVYMNSFNAVLYITDEFGGQGAFIRAVAPPTTQNTTIAFAEGATQVPLPGAAGLLALGAGALAALRRRKG